MSNLDQDYVDDPEAGFADDGGEFDGEEDYQEYEEHPQMRPVLSRHFADDDPPQESYDDIVSSVLAFLLASGEDLHF